MSTDTPSSNPPAPETVPEAPSAATQPAPAAVPSQPQPQPQAQPQPADPRRRMRELMAIPERDRTDAQWDELNELEIQFAPGNRINPGQQPGPVGAPRAFTQKKHPPKGDKGGGGGGGGGGGKGGGGKGRRPPHKQPGQG